MSDADKPRSWMDRFRSFLGGERPTEEPPHAEETDSEPPTAPRAPEPSPRAPRGGSSFGIRRVEGAATRPASQAFLQPPPSPEPISDSAEEEEDEPSISISEPSAERPTTEAASHTGAMFRRASDALSFLGAVSSAGLATEALSLAGTDGRVWVEAPVPPVRAAPLAFLAHGRPFGGQGEHRWVAALSDGRLLHVEVMPEEDGITTLITGDRVERLLPPSFRTVDLRGLLSACALRRIALRSRPEVMIAMPPPLARWVLGRSIALGLDAALATAEGRPLMGDGPAEGVVWMRLRGEGKRGVPVAWLASLTDLPGVMATYPVGAESQRLFVDVRCEAPLAGPLLEALLPGEDGWLLGGEDTGHRRIGKVSEFVPGASLLRAPLEIKGGMGSTRSDGRKVRLPEPLAVKLVRRRVNRPVDAVLIDETEVGWLRTYWMARPLGETLYLVGGARHVLVLAPGGLAAAVPFGVELSRVGPGGLYVEQGLDFSPPLPEEARLKAFGPSEATCVVVTEREALSFDVEATVPAWTLWAGPAPEMRVEKAGEAAQKLAAIAKALDGEGKGKQEEKPRAGMVIKPVEENKPLGPNERAKLRKDAAKAELRGDLAEAAKLLEQVGDAAAAGRLYERAAVKSV